MIAACPKCKTRYRIEAEQLTPEGLRLRCKACSAIFRVKPPPIPSSNPPAPSAAGDTPATAPPAPSEGARRDRQRLVLVAHPDEAACKQTCDALGRWGLEALQAHDGVEAILTLQRTLPRAVVLDAGLSKMYGFQVCELVKRNESLRSTWVVLVGALHHADRYRRPPSDLYGADAYVEPNELPDALVPILRRFGLPLREATAGAPEEAVPRRTPTPVLPEPPVSSVPPPSPAPAPAAPTPAPADAALDAERAKAERLARIVISDIVLYNPEKFDAGIESGDLLGTLADELEEGRALFRERIDARIREERDYLGDELLRVARSRGMT